MGGTIRITVAQNGAIKTDMKGFKSCAKKTKEMLDNLDISADQITTDGREVEVQQVSTARQRVSR